MTTFKELVDSISSSLHAYTGIHESTTWLTAGIDASVLSATVNTTDGAFRGMAEIDDELVYIDTADSGTITLAPFGRGYRSSTAASHSTNAQVTFDPIFPRVEIKKAVNQCLAGLYPALYQMKTATLTYTHGVIGYELPADAEEIISVTWETLDPLNFWDKVASWSYDSQSATATGRMINIFECGIYPGRSIRVVYKAKFTDFASDADTFATAGLRESYNDLIIYGVTSRLIRFLDIGRIQTGSVENLSRSQVVQANDAGKIANQLYAMYQQRVAEERNELLTLTPPQIHFTR